MIPSNTARAGGVDLSDPAVAPEDDCARSRRDDARVRAFLTLAAYNGTVITSAMFITAMVANPLVVQLAADQGSRDLVGFVGARGVGARNREPDRRATRHLLALRPRIDPVQRARAAGSGRGARTALGR